MRKYIGIESKKGSLVVETAVFLPLFLVSVLTLGLFIRQAGIEETVFHSLLNQGRLCGISAYTILHTTEGIDDENSLLPGIAGLGTRQLFRAGLETQLQREIGMESSAMDLETFRHLYSEDGRSDLIEAAVSFSVEIPLPLRQRNEMKGSCKILLRGFTGAEPRRVSGVAAADMEKPQPSQPVYVFPREGERYHREDCVTITSSPVRCVLTGSLRRSHKPCSLCKPEETMLGSSVFCFPGYGEAYHKGGCQTTEKYVKEMELTDAVDMGYTPCTRCGGIK